MFRSVSYVDALDVGVKDRVHEILRYTEGAAGSLKLLEVLLELLGVVAGVLGGAVLVCEELDHLVDVQRSGHTRSRERSRAWLS